MPPLPNPDNAISIHRFKHPGIRLWLPLTMSFLLMLCGWLITPRIRILEFVALLLLVFIVISSLVSVGELLVVEEGLIINRLMMPVSFVPWDAINRVLIYAHGDGDYGAHIEITSISFHEGLSPLNRLPGLVYGQGFRQTIIITPDTVEQYERLLIELEAHIPIEWHGVNYQE